eukprot:298528_1
MASTEKLRTEPLRAKQRQRGMPRIQSEPAFKVLKEPRRSAVRQRRKSTVLHPSEHYNPRIVLQIILSQPYHAYIGVTPNLRPLIELTINDLKEQSSAIDEAESDRELIDQALSRLELEELKSKFNKSFVPLQASIANFATILEQKYTHTLIYAICHALIGSFLAGFNTSLLNVPAQQIATQCHLSLSQFSSLQSMYCVGGLVGALLAGWCADRYGRRITLLFANCMFMTSGIISMLYALSLFGAISVPQTSFKYFILSRIISGLASGICTAIVPTYLGEISPPIIRGEIGTLNAFINAFGILFAEVISFNYLLGGASTWPFIFTVNVLPTLTQIMFIKTFCESPQWLLYNNKRTRAERVFQWLRQSDDVLFDMRSIKTKQFYDETAKLKVQTPSPSKKTKSKENSALLEWTDEEGAQYGTATMTHQHHKANSNRCCGCQCNIVLIYIFFVTICLQILQQFSGINSVWYYSSIMLQNAGLTSSSQLWIGNILIASSNFFGVLIPVKLIEKIGRKLLIYLSCGGMIIAEILLSLTMMFAEDMGSAAGYLSIIILILYVLCFAMGLGPIVGLLTVELSPSSHRGLIVSVAFFINYSANLFVAQFANQVVEYVYYIPFAGICALGIIFIYFCLPETKGKKENDIQAEILCRVTKSQPLDIYS